LKVDGKFDYCAVIVDNDREETARAVVMNAKNSVPFDIEYHVEPDRNIALARNLAVARAPGDLVAFIDDDEYPHEDWLLLNYRSLVASGADGVLGPVIPYYDSPPPPWLVKSGLLSRKRFPTLHQIKDPRYLRTGNALLWKHLFDRGQSRFDPKYGRSGGEDANFFRKKLEEGRTFIWCDEACVFETVPPERQKMGYYIQRAFTRGMTTAWSTPFLSIKTPISIAAAILYSVLLPFTILLGKHVFIRILVKDCSHLAKLAEYAGIRFTKERPSGTLTSGG
jgi:glycosyltransferase involved in cell wall biosynthesis